MRIIKSIRVLPVLRRALVLVALLLLSFTCSMPAAAAPSVQVAAQSTTTAATQPGGTTTPSKKTVLVLFPYQSNLPVSELATSALKEEFGSAGGLALDVYYEYLDLNRFPDATNQKRAFDLLAAGWTKGSTFLRSRTRSMRVSE